MMNQARPVEDVEQLGAEPTFEVVGHRLHHGVRNRRHRGRAGQFRPKLGLGLERGAGEPPAGWAVRSDQSHRRGAGRGRVDILSSQPLLFCYSSR